MLTDNAITALVSPHEQTIRDVAATFGATVTSIRFGGAISRAERKQHVARIQVRLAGADWTEARCSETRRELKAAIKRHLLSVGCGRISVHLLAE